MGLISKPNTFSAGAVIVASEHNANFDEVYNLVNGSISNANISASAAIATSKLDFSGGISGTGAITYASGSHPKRSIYLTAGGATVPTTNGAAQVQTNSGTEGRPSYWTLDYDQTTDEHAFWSFVMPDSFDNAAATATIYWTTACVNAMHEVEFLLQFLGRTQDDAIDATMGSTIGITDNTPAGWTANDVLISPVTTIKVGSLCAAGDLVFVKLDRDANGTVATNIAADAKVLGIKIEWGKSVDTD
jgi:hypothetical protein